MPSKPERAMFLVDKQTSGRASILRGFRNEARKFLRSRSRTQWMTGRASVRSGLDVRLATAQKAVADLTWVYLDALHEERAPGSPSTTPPQDVPDLWDSAFEAFDLTMDESSELEQAITSALEEVESVAEDALDEVVLDASTQHGDAINTRESAAGRPPKVIGYRRIVHPDRSVGGVCGMCIVAATRIYKRGDLRKIHDNCKCTVAQITAASDPGDALNKLDLPGLYRQADGTGRADLKRTRYKGNPYDGDLTATLVPKRRKSAAQKAAEDRRAKADAARSAVDYDKRIASLEKAITNTSSPAQEKNLQRRLEDEKKKRELAVKDEAFVLKQIEIYTAMPSSAQRTKQLARYRAEARRRGLRVAA